MLNLKIENKIINATSAVASGILTELIYSELSNSYYEKQIINDVETFIEINQTPFWKKFIFILLVFLTIWILISIIIPRTAYLVKSFHRKRKPTYNTKEMTIIFNKILENIQNISFALNNNCSRISLEILYFDEIATSINRLYAIFCSTNLIQKRTVKIVFRDSSSAAIKDNQISKVEFYYLLCIMDKLLNEYTKTKPNDENLAKIFETDITALQDKLEELKEIIKR